ncbi:hypothetical protein [Kocuria rosea]|uniref:hypothetical protein n=1 Tax=Kocuria rosea TaxID=1275 RepID=UPI002B2411BF|nr:hypothetical protein [Kocuria rosea]
MNLTLSQRGAKQTATQATYSEFFECEGNGEPVTLTYEFVSSGSTFKNGTAVITGDVQYCTFDFITCGNQRVGAQEINLRK